MFAMFKVTWSFNTLSFCCELFIVVSSLLLLRLQRHFLNMLFSLYFHPVLCFKLYCIASSISLIECDSLSWPLMPCAGWHTPALGPKIQIAIAGQQLSSASAACLISVMHLQSRSYHCSDMTRYRSQFSVRPPYLYCINVVYHIEATTRVQFLFPFHSSPFTHKRGRLSWGGELSYHIQNSISISSSSARTFVSTGWRIKIYAFVLAHSRTLTARPHCPLFRLSRPLIGFVSLRGAGRVSGQGGQNSARSAENFFFVCPPWFSVCPPCHT